MSRPPRRRGPLGPLPAFTWDESEHNWTGKQPTIAAPDEPGDGLPIAYLRHRLEADGLTIHYESPKSAFPTNRLRVPCILFGGPSDLFSTLPSVWKDRFDRLGIVHAGLPVIPEVDDIQPQQFCGLPSLLQDEETGVWNLKNPETYVGYRVYVWYGAAGNPYQFIDLNIDDFDSTVLPIEVCSEGTLGTDDNPCNDDFCVDYVLHEYEHAPTDAISIPVTDFAPFVSIFEEHVARFNGYRIAAWSGTSVSDIFVNERCGCGNSIAEACDPIEVIVDGNTVPIYIGTDEAFQDVVDENFMEIWGQLPEDNRYLPESVPDLFDVLTDALLFFEKLPL